MDNRQTKLIGILAIGVALLLGVAVGMATGIGQYLFGGPKPETIASASLQSMRAQNRLIAFVARYVSVTTSTSSRFGLTSKRTLILPGDVRYELDLAKLEAKDVSWDDATHTLNVRLPEIELAGPDVDLNAAQEYGEGGVLSALTNSDEALDSANRAKAVADLRKQASGPLQMRLAHQAARAAIERSFAMPLAAAGITDAKVVARFPTEGTDDASYVDLSTPYADAINEAERRRAQGQR
jgi:hypothetical protein